MSRKTRAWHLHYVRVAGLWIQSTPKERMALGAPRKYAYTEWFYLTPEQRKRFVEKMSKHLALTSAKQADELLKEEPS